MLFPVLMKKICFFPLVVNIDLVGSVYFWLCIITVLWSGMQIYHHCLLLDFSPESCGVLFLGSISLTAQVIW